MRYRQICFVIGFGVFCASVHAAIPLQINHQGVIKVNGVPFDGNGNFRFAFVDPDTGQNLWTNDGSTTGTNQMPTAAVSLPVINGIYNVRLGDSLLPNMVPIASAVFNDDNVVLRIWFDDGVNGNRQLSPDQPVTSAGYVYHALTAETADNGVPSGGLILDVTSAPPTGWTHIGDVLQSDSSVGRARAEMPVPRTQFGVGVLNSRIYAIGGTEGPIESSGPVGTNQAYDPSLNSWLTYTSMPTPRQRLAIGVVNGKIYAIGGGAHSIVGTNEEYDPVANTWAPKADLPQARTEAAIAVLNGLIYVLGGYASSVASTNFIYNPESNTWAQGTSMPEPLEWTAACVVDNRIYVIGGTGASQTPVDTVFEYDPVGDSWTRKAPMPTPRFQHSAVVVGQAIYALGGRNDSTTLHTVEQFIPSQNAWYPKPSMIDGRRNFGAGVVGEEIYAFGGFSDAMIGDNEEYPVPNIYFLHRKD
jgi:hypothetical protein